MVEEVNTPTEPGEFRLMDPQVCGPEEKGAGGELLVAAEVKLQSALAAANLLRLTS